MDFVSLSMCVPFLRFISFHSVNSLSLVQMNKKNVVSEIFLSVLYAKKAICHFCFVYLNRIDWNRIHNIYATISYRSLICKVWLFLYEKLRWLAHFNLQLQHSGSFWFLLRLLFWFVNIDVDLNRISIVWHSIFFRVRLTNRIDIVYNFSVFIEFHRQRHASKLKAKKRAFFRVSRAILCY